MLGEMTACMMRISSIRRTRERTFLVSTLKVLFSHQLDQGVVDPGAVRQPEAASRTELVEEEKLLVLSNLAMVAFGGLGEESLVFGQLFLVGEGDTVDTLQRLIVRVAEEVRGRVLGDHHRLDFAGMGDVRANTEINHRSAAVYSRGGAVGNFGLNEILFELVVLIGR